MRIGSELGSTGPLTARAAPSDWDKLHKASHEFEGILLGSLWKEAQQGLEDGQEEDGLGIKMDGPLQDIGFQALAGRANKSGGLGIGKMIEKSLTKSAAANGHSLAGPQDSAPPAGHTGKALPGWGAKNP
jgi:Rod binding domain-containing protein